MLVMYMEAYYSKLYPTTNMITAIKIFRQPNLQT